MNILFVDDEHVNLFLHKEITRRTMPGCTIFTADGVDEALALLRINWQRQFIIFLDMNIGSQSGLDFLAEFSLLKNSSRVFILSSSVDEEEIDRAMAYEQVEAFLPKPFTEQYLQFVIGTASDCGRKH